MEEHQGLSQETIDALGEWGTVVSRKSRRRNKQATLTGCGEGSIPKSHQPPVATLNNEVDLDKLLAQNPRLKKVSRQHLLKAMRRMPQELVCEANEILCLVDSGSTINAVWIEKHFPAYAKHIKALENAQKSRTATTACGKILHEKGRCTVFGKIEGHASSIDFRDMEVEMPILSVRKIIKKRNLVQFEEDGGYIKNRDTGHQTKFYECDGAYFLKLRIDDPEVVGQLMSSNKGKGSGSSFPRPGQ